uniref:SSD domain-containing protein n=1 Tax=Angiostrongylus cantonensis TaxID=6313 RepID=A0A158P7N8_ANGCA
MMKIKWAPLERPWASLMSKYCVFVSRYPWPFIIFPCFLTIILSSGIVLRLQIVRGVHYLYSPLNARWKSEEAVFGENWAADDDHFYPGKDVPRRRGLYLIVEAKDKGNVLRSDHAVQFLQVSLTKKAKISKGFYRKYSLQNECFSNVQAMLIADIFARNDQAKFNIFYPRYRTRFATEPIDVSRTLGGVTLDGDRVQSAKAWLVLFQLKHHGSEMEKLSGDFEKSIVRSIESDAVPGSLLSILYFHSDTFEQELANENKRIIPMFSVTFSVLILFSILCTFNLPVIDWVKSLMAIVSSTGLLLLLNVTFVDICTVMPFLSLTIGIDDSFLMLAAWHDTSRHLDVVDRVGLSMRHAAVSISITTLTDALAFLIGAIAPLPAVKFFCLYSFAAIVFIFLYCLTIFVGCLALQGRLEAKNLNSLLMTPVKDLARPGNTVLNILSPIINSTNRFIDQPLLKNSVYKSENSNNFEKKVQISIVHKRMWYQKFFEDYYAPFVVNRWTVVFSIFLFGVYASVAAAGIQKVVVGFDLINIVLVNSRPRHFLELRKKFFPDDITRMDIAVMRPPSMALANERLLFLKFLEKIESTSCSVGRNSTEFWYFSFENYMKTLGFGDTFIENSRGFFLANDKYSYDVTRAFRFSTRLRNVSSDELIHRCAQWMRLVDNYGTLLITYTPLWNLADQYEIMWPQTLQDLYISIIKCSLSSLLHSRCSWRLSRQLVSFCSTLGLSRSSW